MSEEVDNKFFEFLKEQNFEFLFHDYENNTLIN
jgi:hypothetical protein